MKHTDLPSIVLAAINARYTHTSLGARCLLASMDVTLQSKTHLMEFNIGQTAADIVADIIAFQPGIVGMGVFIWNRNIIEAVVASLRECHSPPAIILGGPEITYDPDSRLAQSADVVIRGEAEHHWAGTCRSLLAGRPVQHDLHATPFDLADVPIPDRFYSSHDLQKRHIYIETSRGCPLHCAFCLSSIDKGVRYYPEHKVTEALERLLQRGGRQFRFVDRSFNLGGARSERLLDFFLERQTDDLRLHFEMTPDGLRSHGLRLRLQQFAPGILHLEAGIQSFNPTVLANVQRPTNIEAAAEGLAWLTRETGAIVHADLIAGLPGESLESFIDGFNRLYRSGPHEIQVGILKRLHGTPLAQQAKALGLRFRTSPPYDIIETPDMCPGTLLSIRRFAAHWDRVVNRQHFPKTVKRLLQEASSPWHTFDRLSQRVNARYGHYGIGWVELARELLSALEQETKLAPDEARFLLRTDYIADGRRQNVPSFLR